MLVDVAGPQLRERAHAWQPASVERRQLRVFRAVTGQWSKWALKMGSNAERAAGRRLEGDGIMAWRGPEQARLIPFAFLDVGEGHASLRSKSVSRVIVLY